MLTGSFVTMAGFVPIGFAQSAAGEYTFSIFAVVGIALLASWLVAVLFIAALGVALLSKPKAAEPAEPGMVVAHLPQLLIVGDADALDHHPGDGGLLRHVAARVALCAATVLSVVRPAGASGRSELAAKRLDPMPASDLSAKLDGILKDDPDVERWSAYVGRGAIRFYLPLNVELANDFFTQFVVVAKDVAARERLHAKLEQTCCRRVSEGGGTDRSAGAWAARSVGRCSIGSAGPT